MTARELMLEAVAKLKEAGIDKPWFEAQLLLGWVLGKDQAAVLTHDEIALSDQQAQLFRQGVEERRKRKPFAFITGIKPFLHWDFCVNEDVLIPRPETEILVELAVQELNKGFPGQSVLVADIGAGSGAIGLSMLMLLPAARLYAVDCSILALKVAQKNAEKFGLVERAIFLPGDLLAPLEQLRGQFACIVANLPYVAAREYADLQPEISGYEPREALVSGADGLCHYRRLLRQAADYLLPGGLLFVEIGSTQAQEVQRLFRSGGFAAPQVEKDLAGLARIVWGTKTETAI
ncbi:MAG TPA: peptide chain release factor N(5)-glutamine methyltransferase [Firmicutes bacterium]|jgi:release factor glutamine methyltransferase|nr:peptide chain release factor N(5)-glutamine methyltransferase [Bacillota bacterium]